MLGLVGSSISIPCLFSTDSESQEADRTALVASDRNRATNDVNSRRTVRPRLDLNHTYDSVRLVLFYKESIKSGPIYSIDSRFATHFKQARHFAAPSFSNERLSIEDDQLIDRGLTDATLSNSNPDKQPAIRLRISSLKPSDSGDYKCRIDFRRGRTITTHVNLKVIGR